MQIKPYLFKKKKITFFKNKIMYEVHGVLIF